MACVLIAEQRSRVLKLFVGNDWASDHHDVCVVDGDGNRLAERRFDEGIVGLAGFHGLIGSFDIEDPSEVVIGIESDRGLWVEALVASGYRVFAINPRSAARYRDRHSVSGAKSDRGDAFVLAEIVRLDRDSHREIAGDSPEAAAIGVLARGHQTLIWERTRHSNRLRHTLAGFYPAALVAFDKLYTNDALAVLAKAPSPEAGAALRVSQIKAVLKKGGRQRYLDAKAIEIQTALRESHLTAAAPVAAAMAVSVAAQVDILQTLQTQIAAMEKMIATHFDEHPEADVYRSLPGLGAKLSPRVLGEFGDDPERFTSAKSRRNYAGTSPLTIESGKRRVVTNRHIKNNRLYDAIDQWAFCSLQDSPGCRQFYDQHRAAGDSHHTALRALGNRLVGYLHGCLRNGALYDEHIAWGTRHNQHLEQTA